MNNLEFRTESTVELIKSNADDRDVAYSAWVSNNFDPREKDAGRIEGLIKFLVRERHTSPIEHGSFTFYVQTPLFVAREFMRHRTWSYNEVSGRYSEMEPMFYIPGDNRPLVQSGKIGNYHFTAGSDTQVSFVQEILKKHSADSWFRYVTLKQNGVANEVARDLLPLNLMTSFYATTNPLNLMRFLTLRTADQALYEIRQVAGQMESYFEKQMPITHTAWKEYGI